MLYAKTNLMRLKKKKKKKKKKDFWVVGQSTDVAPWLEVGPPHGAREACFFGWWGSRQMSPHGLT
jgi:hypothetical protein